MNDYIRKILAKSLSDFEQAECDKAISVKELQCALKKLPGGKSPGIDGLPAEFFRYFWDDLKGDFLDVLSESLNSEMLPELMRMSVVTLIYKKKSRQDIRNYRSIFLLCTDYKIVAKALAERMKLVLPGIIHPDQTGFLKDRYISENITMFLDIQEHLAADFKPGLAFLADLEKPYDLIDRDFLKSSLTQMGFGNYFLQWFSVLHFGTVSQITINSFMTDPFPVVCGVRQGCPWAPLSFLCAVEPLPVAFRNSGLVDIMLPDQKRIVYSGYADDTAVYMNELDDLTEVLRIFKDYSFILGMKLSNSKCLVIPLGSSIDLPKPETSNFRWLNDESDLDRLLGVPVGLKFCNDLIRKDLLSELDGSIRH
jgi:hypothetical protein